jgi:glutathione S-transferase
MQGQVHYFRRYAREYAKRYTNETRRLYGVLDKHLAASKAGYLVGSHISVADISHWGWIAFSGWVGVEINDFPYLKVWEQRVAQHRGVEKGRHVPEPHVIKETLKDKIRS